MSLLFDDSPLDVDYEELLPEAIKYYKSNCGLYNTDEDFKERLYAECLYQNEYTIKKQSYGIFCLELEHLI